MPEALLHEENPADDLARVAAALAFAADEPVPPARIAAAFAAVTGAEVTEAEVEAAVEVYNRTAVDADAPLRIERWAGGYRMATAPALAPFVRAHFDEDRRTRLSRSLMETLAVVAYRQPATKPEIDFVRGVDAGYAVGKLLDLGIVDVVGRSEAIGRPLLYGTTPRFLELFGLDALGDLPRLREIEDLLADPHFNRERARLLALEGLVPSAGEEQAAEPRVDTAPDDEGID